MKKTASFLKKNFRFNDQTPELVNHKNRTKKISGNKISGDLNNLIVDYLNRFSIILNTSEDNKEKTIEAFKRKIFHDNIIKEDEIPQNYWDLQMKIIEERGQSGDLTNGEIPEELRKQETQRIISEQKKSLENWIYYLSNETQNYNIGLKYWVFRSVLGLQSFDKKKNKFGKRTKSTVANFPELDREALIYVLDFITKKINSEEIKKPHSGVSDETFNKIIKKENFSLLYAFAIKEVTVAHGETLKNTKGQWIKYDKGSDHLKLVKTLEGKGTGWCTVGEDTAEKQLAGGDFYIYYSQDKNQENKIPRVAIRMEGNSIAEVRGIDEQQNIDPYIGEVLGEKLKEFGVEGKKYQKKASDMKELTEIYNIFKEKQESGESLNLSKNQLIKLYKIRGETFEGFGYNHDPRVRKILESRNREKDLAFIFDCKEEEISSNKADILNGKKIVFFDGNISSSLTQIPDGVKFPENIGGNLYLRRLTQIPDGFEFPESIGGYLNLESLEKIPDGFKFPENIGGDLILESLEKIPDGFKFPENIGGDLNLNSLKEIPDGVKFPENIGQYLILSNLNQEQKEQLKKENPNLDIE